MQNSFKTALQYVTFIFCKALKLLFLQKPFRKKIKNGTFLLDETASLSYNVPVLGTRRKTGSWVQKGPFHRVVGLPLVFGSGGDFFQGESGWNYDLRSTIYEFCMFPASPFRLRRGKSPRALPAKYQNPRSRGWHIIAWA